MKKGKRIALYALLLVGSIVLGIVSNVVFPHGIFYKDPLNVKWSDSVGTITKDISYGDSDLTKFDLALPADNSREHYGLMVQIHGGGYMNGDKSGDESYLKYYVSKGYVAASINYDLNADGNYISISDISEEIKNAIPVIIEEAAQRGYRIDKMAIVGGSAGAHLSMLYAYRDAADSPVPVAFVVDMVGPTSFEPDAWYGFGEIVNVHSQVVPNETVIDHPTVDYNDSQQAQAGSEWVSRLTGQEVTPAMMADGSYQEILKDISPYALVTENTVPTIVAYALSDKVLPSSMEGYLLKSLQQYGIKYDRIPFPKSGHAMQNDPGPWQELFVKIDEYLDTYMPLNESE